MGSKDERVPEASTPEVVGDADAEQNEAAESASSESSSSSSSSSDSDNEQEAAASGQSQVAAASEARPAGSTGDEPHSILSGLKRPHGNVCAKMLVRANWRCACHYERVCPDKKGGQGRAP